MPRESNPANPCGDSHTYLSIPWSCDLAKGHTGRHEQHHMGDGRLIESWKDA